MYQRVQFAPGAYSEILNGSVILGDRDTYVLGAEANQTMNVYISSLEDNAVFDLLDPYGGILAQETTVWQGLLPASGDYSVVVGGTRGNATYTVQFEIY